MKKYFILGLLTLGLTFTACKKEEQKTNELDAISKSYSLMAPTDLSAFLSTPLRSDMYGYDAQQNFQQLQFFGYSSIGDTTPEQWYYDSSSTATDNGTTVIKPTAISGAGRWLYLYKVPTASTVKKQETASGTTNSSGQYTFTFPVAYSVAPNVQANIIGGTDSQIIKIGTPSTTSVTVTVRNRTDIVGLLPTWSNVNGANVDLLVTQK